MSSSLKKQIPSVETNSPLASHSPSIFSFLAPPGLSSTLQGVVYGVSFGLGKSFSRTKTRHALCLGRGVGLIVSSFIYTHYESRRLFLVYAIYNTVAAALYSIYFLLTRAKSDKPKRTPRNTNVPTIVIESGRNTPSVSAELVRSILSCRYEPERRTVTSLIMGKQEWDQIDWLIVLDKVSILSGREKNSSISDIR